ncbi:MAG: response regulator [Candidatus Omnitrophica bacterium]|nr:response regulator [Candidatus Omnitrophota bacterium]
MAKILIIEDQKDIIKLISARLKANGYTVVAAQDGQMGFDLIAKEKPDLVITDMAMPGLNGNLVVRKVREMEEIKNIPIIMLSAFVHDKTGEGVEVPADFYIKKPFEAPFLLEKIKELLEKKE